MAKSDFLRVLTACKATTDATNIPELTNDQLLAIIAACAADKTVCGSLIDLIHAASMLIKPSREAGKPFTPTTSAGMQAALKESL